MAIALELVINYGLDNDSAAEARRFVLAHPPLRAGKHDVLLHEPLLATVRGLDDERYLEMAVVPARVGWGVGMDQHQERLALTVGELSELGFGLYALLSNLTGYRVARVGWDPEGFIDPAELQQDWADELAAGRLPGLVVAGRPRRRVSPGAGARTDAETRVGVVRRWRCSSVRCCRRGCPPGSWWRP